MPPGFRVADRSTGNSKVGYSLSSSTSGICIAGSPPILSDDEEMSQLDAEGGCSLPFASPTTCTISLPLDSSVTGSLSRASFDCYRPVTTMKLSRPTLAARFQPPESIASVAYSAAAPQLATPASFAKDVNVNKDLVVDMPGRQDNSCLQYPGFFRIQVCRTRSHWTFCGR